jgi:rod shape-determining protein MreB
MILGNVLNIETFIDLGLDPGSANTLMCIKDQGIVVNEPTIVAVESDSGKLLAFGHDALNMHQKMHPGIQTIFPVNNGLIGDYDNAQKLFRELLHHVKPRILFGIHRMGTSVPIGLTEVGKRAFFDMAEHLGAKEAWLVFEPIAAAIGAGINPLDTVATLIVNLGAGTTQIAVLSLGGIVSGESLSVSGNQINNDIIQHLREKNNLAISDYAAEQIKLQIAAADRLDRDSRLPVKGFNLRSGFPETQEISTIALGEVIAASLQEIVKAIKKCIEVLADKPDVAVDILERGIFLTGGGALLAGIDKIIHSETGLPVTICDEPQTAVIKGLCKILENFELYQPALINSKNKHKP